MKFYLTGAPPFYKIYARQFFEIFAQWFILYFIRGASSLQFIFRSHNGSFSKVLNESKINFEGEFFQKKF